MLLVAGLKNPTIRRRYLATRELLGDLGIASYVDLQRRGERVEAFLPRVWEITEAIMVANPGIED